MRWEEELGRREKGWGEEGGGKGEKGERKSLLTKFPPISSSPPISHVVPHTGRTVP